MREGIHPDYYQATVTCNCGNTFVTGSTLDGADFTLEGIEAYRVAGSKPEGFRVTSYVITLSLIHI